MNNESFSYIEVPRSKQRPERLSVLLERRMKTFLLERRRKLWHEEQKR